MPIDSIIPAPIVLQIIRNWLKEQGELQMGGKHELFFGSDGSIFHRFTPAEELCTEEEKQKLSVENTDPTSAAVSSVSE